MDAENNDNAQDQNQDVTNEQNDDQLAKEEAMLLA